MTRSLRTPITGSRPLVGDIRVLGHPYLTVKMDHEHDALAIPCLRLVAYRTPHHPNACASTSQPLGKAERARLQEEEKILVYGEEKNLNGLLATSRISSRRGGEYLHGSLGLVRAPLIRDATIDRIRKLSGLTNFVLLDAPLSRNFSQVDPLSQDAVFRSAYRGIYLVFRSGWELRNNQDQLYGATGRDLLYGPIWTNRTVFQCRRPHDSPE